MTLYTETLSMTIINETLSIMTLIITMFNITPINEKVSIMTLNIMKRCSA
jgi:hypothetical protein